MTETYGGPLVPKSDPDDCLRRSCECGVECMTFCSDPRCGVGICEAHYLLCEGCGGSFCQKCVGMYAYGEFNLCRECMKTVPADYEKDNPRTEKEAA